MNIIMWLRKLFRIDKYDYAICKQCIHYCQKHNRMVCMMCIDGHEYKYRSKHENNN